MKREAGEPKFSEYALVYIKQFYSNLPHDGKVTKSTLIHRGASQLGHCTLFWQIYGILFSGGSRISRRGRAPVRGGVDLRCGCFLVKMYAKTKEFGPIWGGVHPARPLDPPMLF